jgi:hypothetical protein
MIPAHEPVRVTATTVPLRVRTQNEATIVAALQCATRTTDQRGRSPPRTAYHALDNCEVIARQMISMSPVTLNATIVITSRATT